MKPDVTITADGACFPNDGTGAGGWAFVLRTSREGVYSLHEGSGGLSVCTNNVAELTAILEALKFNAGATRDLGVNILLRSDSQYAINCCTKWGDKWERNGWQKKKTGGEIKNLALIQQIRSLAKWHNVTWEWVRGHAGDPDNERCDKLAQGAMPEKNQREMEKFERWRQANRKPIGNFPLESSGNVRPISAVRAV